MSRSDFFAQTTFFLIAAIAAVAVIVFTLLRRRKAVRLRLEGQFGTAPEKADADIIRRLSDFWHIKQSKEQPESFVDDTTWNDLDMDKVFARIDSCYTSAGEEYLYALLHSPSYGEAPLKEREALMAVLGENPQKRLELQLILSKMGKTNSVGLSVFGYDISSKRLNAHSVYSVLALLPFICAGLFFVSWPAGLAAVGISLIVNVVVHSLTKLYIEKELGVLKYFSSLLWCSKKIIRLNISPEITTALSENLRAFKRLGGKVSSLTRERLSDADMVADYFKVPFLSDIRNYNKAIEAIAKNQKEYRELCSLVGSLDTAIAVLSFRKSLPRFSVPEFTEERVIEAMGIYHPLLSDPVLNDALITRGCLISGSNASGKSTFIKALAVNGILAQTICTCMADKFRTRFALVVTSMAVRDDLTAGESYFITEIKSLRRISETAKSVFCACYIDEILKGTNTVERIAASYSVLSSLSSLPCLCVAATHDIELTRMLEDRYDNFHFEEQIAEDGMTFDYKIRKGPSRSRNAIKLLEFMKFDFGVVSEAQKLVEVFEKTGVWKKQI